MIASRVMIADSLFRRGWGLLGHSSLAEDEGMLIARTNAIHSWFMRFPFDAAYLCRDGTVCRLLTAMPPFRFGPFVRQADSVLELAAGTIDRTGLRVGDTVRFEQAHHG